MEELELAGYRYLDDIAISDAAFEVTADNYSKLFQLAGKAMFGIMLDTNEVSADRQFEVELSEETIEELLYAYLSELLYIKDVEGVILSKFDVTVDKSDLSGTVSGSKFTDIEQAPDVDIKAVTLYRFDIKKLEDGYQAVVVVDL
ncbi:MAG: hypothetical protein GF315_02610 [candidate division Zixibacteria bacterium]|nr:hypothetical protein [candidate division Zixibacteria bacterium]